MRVRHPIADADEGVVDDRINVAGETVPIDADGTFHVPEEATSWLQRWCEANGYDPDDVVVGESADSDANPTPDTPETAIQNGECPWCSAYEGEHVGQHASSAHPEEWAAYQED